jgi:hypothetical protein
MASDSRVRSGGTLDCAPKLIPLPRGDSAIAFAGDTYFAFPLMLQLVQAVNSYSPLLDRASNFSALRSHTLSMFTNMIDSFEGDVKGLEVPGTEFVLAGYSWTKRTFEIDVLSYNETEKRFIHHPAKTGIGKFGLLKVSGDRTNEALKRLYGVLRQRFGDDSVKPDSNLKRGFDMEPFEVLRDIIRDSGHDDTVGGAPQILKITLYLECRSFAVYWPNRDDGSIYLGGRKLLEYENVDNWILDPDTFAITHPHFSSNEDDESDLAVQSVVE